MYEFPPGELHHLPNVLSAPSFATYLQTSENNREDALRPPGHGSSPTLFIYGGAQPGSSLATGFFTGESTRKPVDELGIKS